VDEKEQRLIEYSIEAVVIAWLAYLFFYQNYLLHSWHRGLPLPSKLPFLVAGIVVAALFFWYEWTRFERELEGRKTTNEAATPAIPEGSNQGDVTFSDERPGELDR